jgi:hypothetical protein
MAVRDRWKHRLTTELGLQAALQGFTLRSIVYTYITSARSDLILVLSPDRTRRARVADGPRLIHAAERERMILATEQAVDLDSGRVAREDADEPDRAAADAT